VQGTGSHALVAAMCYRKHLPTYSRRNIMIHVHFRTAVYVSNNLKIAAVAYVCGRRRGAFREPGCPGARAHMSVSSEMCTQTLYTQTY
jgi:hypothetical protein